MIYNNVLKTIGRTPLVRINRLVDNEDAISAFRELAKNEGILAGISADANVYAAISVTKKAKKDVGFGYNSRLR